MNGKRRKGKNIIGTILMGIGLISILFGSIALITTFLKYRTEAMNQMTRGADAVAVMPSEHAPGNVNGKGAEILDAVEIDGVSTAGVLQTEDAVYAVSSERICGNPANGDFVIYGMYMNLRPGDTVTFTDMNGIFYEYTVREILQDEEEAENPSLTLYEKKWIGSSPKVILDVRQ